MANGVNKMIVLGNLGRDPEVRYAQSGMAICMLSVAVSERRKKGEEWVEHTEWFRVKCFGKTAENAAQYLSKGRQVYVEGKGRHDKYTDKEGVERHTFEVVADNVLFLSGGGEHIGRGAGGGGSGRPAAQGPNAPSPKGQGGGGDDGFYDDDLPF
jgi:single-strand DNA-binding protein